METPVGDFFCNGWCERSNVSSLPICVNPAGGMNSYWEMPFRKSARLTMENIGRKEAVLYYQIDYCLTPIPDNAVISMPSSAGATPHTRKSIQF